jgi:hypothetical protein
MTDEERELVKELRDNGWPDGLAAADLIEAQAARIEALERERDEARTDRLRMHRAIQRREAKCAADLWRKDADVCALKAKAAGAHRAGMLEAARIVQGIADGPQAGTLGAYLALSSAASAIRVAAAASPPAPARATEGQEDRG